MASIRPFRAIRPKTDLASRICELPYDVMSSEEARALASGNPLSFLHVSKPEIDLSPDTNPYSDVVYARGRENFARFLAEGSLAQDKVAAFYVYRQVMGTHTQTGLVATFSCQEYIDGIIKKHELTRPDKEDDRVRHIDSLNAQTGPVFLTYRAVPLIDRWVGKAASSTPSVDFVASDGIRHSAWVVEDPVPCAELERTFNEVPQLYIADGHHRCAAAARVCNARRGVGPSARFLAVAFSHAQLRILPYHRVVKDLNGLSESDFLRRLEPIFERRESSSAAPEALHEVGLCLAGKWHRLRFREGCLNPSAPALERLDVSLLQRQVLQPVLGIDDPRTSQRINFVGGIRGTAELERLVVSGEYACAFALYPTSIDDLMQISDSGGIMPPKSTWFEPKLRDAMFIHAID